MPTGHAERIMPALRRVVLAPQRAARSDGELLSAFVSDRDADAFAELVRRHGRMVLGVCRRVLGDATAADDAFQAAFLVLARRAAAVRPREQVGNWLYGVAYRTALKARSVLARRRSREKQVDVMPERTAPPAAPHWDDIRAVIDEELAALPDKLRVPVVLCDLEGRPQREVAKHLNVPPATLATRLAAARRALAERLTRRGVALSGGALAGLLGTHGAAAALPPALAAGTVRAAEAIAAGTAVGTVVSASAVQLSEGMIRMMLLSKLKAAAVAVATALALTTGAGLGLVPAATAYEPAPAPRAGRADAPEAAARPAAPPAIPLAAADDADADDATFLRRLTQSVRGTPPTDVETFFFVADGDDDKRAKVVEWLTDDDEKRAEIAKKLGVPMDKVKVVRVKVAGDDQRTIEVVGVADAALAGKPVVVTGDVIKLNVAGADRLARPLAVPMVAQIDDKTMKEWTARVQLATDKAKAAQAKAAEALLVWQDAKGAELKQYLFAPNGTAQLAAQQLAGQELFYSVALSGDSDAEFLKRVLTDARGSAPTALEVKYFTQDKDPKKREKLIDELLKEPAVQQKLGEAWKKKVLAAQGQYRYLALPQAQEQYRFEFLPAQVKPNAKPPAPPVPPKPGQPNVLVVPKPPVPPAPPKPGEQRVEVVVGGTKVKPGEPLKVTVGELKVATAQSGKFEKLVDELIAAKKGDEAILEALTLAAHGRLPSDVEKALAGAVAQAPNRKAAWVAVAKALAGPARADVIKLRTTVEPSAPPLPPKPPAPPQPPK